MLETAKADELKVSATFQVYGHGFIARDMMFKNTAWRACFRLLALVSGSDQSVFYHHSFEGYQDTILTYNSRQFYEECQICGTVDFIFGARVAFQNCEIPLKTNYGRRISGDCSWKEDSLNHGVNLPRVTFMGKQLAM
ncbi:pectinesterase, catalytic [Artemisia annua]|uniref:Pectinesterase n=1 Tax=Artemisia annua TaxID=35608 RepID=A0A2U1MR34_ARTAN|nr:pectinesterase, catalytic [Artemisia annua]